MTPLCEENRRWCGEPLLCTLFGQFRRKETNEHSKVKSSQFNCLLLKCFFLESLELWVSMYIEKGSMPLIEHVDWVEANEGRK